MPVDPPSHRAVLEALEADGHRPSEVLSAFVRAMLRRAPDDLLSSVPVEVTAQRLREAFAAADRRPVGEPVIRVRRDPAGTYLEVVSEDRPFLLSTVTSELQARRHRPTRSFHPIVGVTRDEQRHLVGVEPARHAATRESVLQLDLDDPPDPTDDHDLVDAVARLLLDLWTVTDDHGAMRAHIERTATELRAGRSPRADDPHGPDEVAALLDWMLDDHVVLLGVDDTPTVEPGPHGELGAEPTVALGLLRAPGPRRADGPDDLDPPRLWPPGVRGDPDDPVLLRVGRTRGRSPVQRRSRIDVLAVTRTDADGEVTGQVRILGLLTRRGVAEPAGNVPVLRRRLARVFDAEDVVDGSHDAIALTDLFQSLPKDELLRTGSAALHATLMALLHAEERSAVATRIRRDDATRTTSVLCTVPAGRWSTELRHELTTRVAAAFGSAEVDVDVVVDDRSHAVARFLVYLADDADVDEVKLDRLDHEVQRLTRSWDDVTRDELARQEPDPDVRATLVARVLPRLPRSYRDRLPPVHAPPDLALIGEVLHGDTSLLVALRPTIDDIHEAPVRVVVVKRDDPLELSAFLPILESLGLTVVEEHPHRLEGESPPVALHDFGVRAERLDIDGDGDRVAAAILAAWRGHLELDSMNRLILAAGRGWRDVSLLRAYRRVRRQLGTAYTPAYVESTMVAHPDVVVALLDHLHARFDPARPADAPDQAATREGVHAALDEVTRLDHDRILRGMLELIDATLRTNAFRADAVADSGEPYVAFKLDPSRIAEVPRPVPHREIFVHSPRVEGVHLRAGPVARGGLRWSDRRDDVRTEVLDLVKAQVLKNAVIVPTGAKGGFVLLREPADPADLADELRRQYVTFVRGMLDVTDDLDGDEVVPPPDVVRHDGDDPYLVVAADRGTATFSDTANRIARRYGFWLDDAFASGGSHGYDHKQLGITARGAWVAVTRHFRELGIDVEQDPVTVAGIGDMSGDVFGNAMVRSRALRLVAAFDHRHVFLDPDPDPERAVAERQRLRELSGSSWHDYDRDVLGPGGMIVDRQSVRAELTDEVRELLRVDRDALSPLELIRAVLTAPVDLLFAGGVGTYIKASSQRHEDVGDRANDEVRVDATDVRARVIGEGANLSITQAARVELARRGGNLNQDAVDNAAGVAISDLEVNLKILLRPAEDDGTLDREGRDELLEQLTEPVVARALRTVDRQAAAISREVRRSTTLAHAYPPFLARLEASSDLDRAAEVLPSDEELGARADAGAGLTRPELATVLAWAKRDLKATVTEADLPESSLCRAALDRAFPDPVVERFPELPPRHRLRRELIATQLANEVVDRMGPTFVDRMVDETGRPAAEAVRAFQAARATIGADGWWQHLDELETTQDPDRVRELEGPIEELLAALTRTLLVDAAGATLEDRVEGHRAIAEDLLARWTAVGTDDQRRARQAHARWLIDDLVEPELARLLATARDLVLVPDVATVRDGVADAPTPRTASDVASTMLRVGAELGIDRVEEGLIRVTATSPWARRQRIGLAADLRRLRRAAALTALREVDADDPAAVVAGFLEGRRDRVERARALIGDAERADEHVLDALAVAVRTLTGTVDGVT